MLDPLDVTPIPDGPFVVKLGEEQDPSVGQAFAENIAETLGRRDFIVVTGSFDLLDERLMAEAGWVPKRLEPSTPPPCAS